MNTVNNKKIAIIGGGPGGLTLARLLQIKGADVTVYERDENRSVRVQGATLDLHHESGLAALREANLMEKFKAAYRPGADKLCVVDKHATLFMDDEETESEAGFGDAHFRPEIDRGPLRDILLDSLAPDTVVWDSQFASMKLTDNQWKIQFKNGSSAMADIVIGADGGNSKIRLYVTPVKPFYVGITAVEGAVYDSEKNAPCIHKLLNGGKIFALSDEKTLIVSSKGDGSLAFYTGCKTGEYWMRDSGIDFSNRELVVSWFQQEFKDWDGIWLELFQKANLPLMPRPQYCMPLDQTWESLPNITLLGDAAHLMPPYAGEGVNMAMLDALELSQCLMDKGFPDVQTAIAAYEKEMLARASAVAKDTLEQTDALHSEDGLTHLLTLFGVLNNSFASK